MTSRDLAIIN